jgi:hypothetical protein
VSRSSSSSSVRSPQGRAPRRAGCRCRGDGDGSASRPAARPSDTNPSSDIEISDVTLPMAAFLIASVCEEFDGPRIHNSSFRHFPGSPSSNGDKSLPRQLWGWVSAGSRARCRRSSPSWVSAPARSPPNERDRRDPAPLGSHIAPVTSANYREAARLDRGRLGRRQSASTATVVRRDRLARAPLHRPGEPSAQRVMATPPREVGCLAAHHPRSAQR